MKIVVITSWFSENMGYSENFFPKALAKLGHKVHVVTSTAQVYYDSPAYQKTYFKHLGPSIVEPSIKNIDGFTLHRLNFSKKRFRILNPFRFNGIRIHNLQEYLWRLQPNVIQVVSLIDEPTTYDTALYAKKNGKMIFTESHIHASVIRKNNKKGLIEQIRSFIYRFHMQLKTINTFTALCYPIAVDAAEIVESLYHLPSQKIKIQPLGVDTDLFCPANSEELIKERKYLRDSFGFQPDDIVCIYTGRFSLGKNPQLLAEAVDRLQQQHENIHALFLGNGTEDEIKLIKQKRGCIIHSFVNVRELPKYYRAADIGVWPREESTSQLDAAACGLPLILSNAIHVSERVEGNGFLYEEGNVVDLMNKILALKDPKLRAKFATVGVEKVTRRFSWVALASQRVEDYKKYL